jgi:hypothetical protein
MNINRFDLVTLTLVSDLLKLEPCLYFVNGRYQDFHMSVCCDKILLWVPIDFTLWPWPRYLIYLLKTNHGYIFGMAISFEWYVLGLWYLTWVLFVTRPSMGTNKLTLWLWRWHLTYFLNDWYVVRLGYFMWLFLMTRPVDDL